MIYLNVFRMKEQGFVSGGQEKLDRQTGDGAKRNTFSAIKRFCARALKTSPHLSG